jgi:uridine kinase
MHEKFVKPSKESSDIIIKNDSNYKNLFNIIEKVLVKSL